MNTIKIGNKSCDKTKVIFLLKFTCKALETKLNECRIEIQSILAQKKKLAEIININDEYDECEEKKLLIKYLDYFYRYLEISSDLRLAHKKIKEYEEKNRKESKPCENKNNNIGIAPVQKDSNDLVVNSGSYKELKKDNLSGFLEKGKNLIETKSIKMDENLEINSKI